MILILYNSDIHLLFFQHLHTIYLIMFCYTPDICTLFTCIFPNIHLLFPQRFYTTYMIFTCYYPDNRLLLTWYCSTPSLIFTCYSPEHLNKCTYYYPDNQLLLFLKFSISLIINCFYMIFIYHFPDICILFT